MFTFSLDILNFVISGQSLTLVFSLFGVDTIFGDLRRECLQIVGKQTIVGDLRCECLQIVGKQIRQHGRRMGKSHYGCKTKVQHQNKSQGSTERNITPLILDQVIVLLCFFTNLNSVNGVRRKELVDFNAQVPRAQPQCFFFFPTLHFGTTMHHLLLKSLTLTVWRFKSDFSKHRVLS